MLARSELRRRWRSVLVLTLLVAFSGAVVVALVAGARRTESSLARFEDASRSADVEFDAGDVTPAQVDELRRVPGVAAVAELQQLTLISRTGPFQNQFLPTAAQIDRRFGTAVDRPRIIEGRAVHLDAVHEITISESLASALHVGVGDDLSFASFSPGDINQADDADPRARPACCAPHRRHRATSARPRWTGATWRRHRPDDSVPRALPRRDRVVLGRRAAGPHRARQRRR